MSRLPRASSLLAMLLAFTTGSATTGSATTFSDDLLSLAAIPAPSGHEAALRLALKQAVTPACATVERVPLSLSVVCGAERPALVAVAPLDEEGWIVSGLDPRGFARLQSLAREPHRLSAQWLLATPLVIGDAPHRIDAVTVAPSTHLRRGAAGSDAPATLTEVWVDVGAASPSVAKTMGADLLAPASRRNRARRVSGAGRLAGPGIGNRALTYALLLATRALDAAPPPEGAALVFAAEALPGRRGEHAASHRFASPRRVLLLRADFGLARTEASALRRDADYALGSGFLVQGLTARERELLTRSGLRFADASLPADRPAAYGPGPAWPRESVAALGIPVRYSLTPVEMVDPGDAVELARALVVLAGGDPERVAPVGLEPPVAAAPPTADTPAGWLARLVAAEAVSGREEPAREAVRAGLPAGLSAEVDAAGNLVVAVPADAPETRDLAPLLFVAHLDEIGFEVTGFDGLGRARLKPLGGFYSSLFEARPARVRTAAGPLDGVIAPRDNDLDGTTREPGAEDLWLDLGSPAEALGVRAGDRVAVTRELLRIGPRRLSARALDDRVGTTALLVALRRLDRKKLARTVLFAWSTEEEVGLKGAFALAERLRPEVVFAVDTFVSSDSPLEDPRFALAPLGQGAVVRAADNSNLAPPELVERVRSIAREARIPLQVGVTGGGNDGAAFALRGIPDVPLAWPLRSSHSPGEVIDERDLEALAALVQALAERW